MSVIVLYLLAKLIAFIFITLRRVFFAEDTTGSIIMPSSVPLSSAAPYLADRQAA